MWYIARHDARGFESKEELIKTLNDEYGAEEDDMFVIIEGKERKVSAKASWFVND